MVPIVVQVPESKELGPKMRALTEKERRFVYALVICGGNAQDAAQAAGYGDKSDTREQAINAARQAGYALMTRERVLEAINEEAKKRLRAGALLAAEKMISLMNDPNLGAKDLLRLTDRMLDRAGLVVEQRVEVTTKTESETQVLRQIEQLAAKVGLDPKALIGHALADRIVDAEFTVVETEAFKLPPELEDIL